MNSLLNSVLPWKIRSGGFIIIVFGTLFTIMLIISIWVRYCRGFKSTNRRGKTIYVGITGRVVHHSLENARQLIIGLRSALEADLGRAVDMEMVYYYDQDDETTAMAVSELCAQCGVPVVILMMTGNKKGQPPPGAWKLPIWVKDIKEVGNRVDGIICTIGEHVSYARTKKHKVWSV